jgi:hypothetical protein
MATNEKKLPPDALKRMLESVERDPLRPETPSELVDEELRAAGGDPERIRKDGAALAKQLLEKRRETIKDRLRKDLAARRSAAANAPRISRESRDELLAMLAAVQASHRYTGQITAMFRKRSVGEVSNEELATLLEEIEAARLAGDDGDDGEST